MATSNYSLFSVMGLEIEYMLVDKASLDVQAKSDLIIHALAGTTTNEIELGDTAVSNEIVLHVLEIKNNGPKPFSTPIENHFQQTILSLQPLLEQHNLQLLPTGAHPWMDPQKETKRWPHGDMAIYQQYDAIFNCQGHGWSNLQSMHVNLPFANDEEFFQLHSLIRLLLPLLPALAASTPFLDGKRTGLVDSRLDFYGKNQQRIPSISGNIIPEFIRNQAEYERDILKPMYEEIKPFDPSGLLQYEWLNSRAAIPKFAYQAVEIRILDSQECVNADIAIARVIFLILKSWHKSSTLHLEKACDSHSLKAIFDATIKKGFDVEISDLDVLEQWQLPKRSMALRDAWSLLIERVCNDLDMSCQRALEQCLSHGNLSDRIVRACRGDDSKKNLTRIYRQLSESLLTNQQFIPS